MLKRFALVPIAALALGLPALADAATTKSDGSTVAPTSVTAAVTSVPQATLDAVGVGLATGRDSFAIRKLGGAAAVAPAKAKVVSFNAAWCPHCAANSWALAVALSRFGTLTGLRSLDTGTYFAKQIKAKPAYSHTKGLSFSRASYTSQWVDFQPVIFQARDGKNVSRPTKSQNLALTKASGSKRPGFPTVAVGDSYGFLGSGFSPGRLTGLSQGTIARRLSDPTSTTAQAILGEANVLTAAICAATGGQPAAVCTAPGTTAGAGRLG